MPARGSQRGMIRRRTIGPARAVALAAPAAAPGLVILAGLWLAGVLAPGPALALAVAAFAATALVATRLALAVGALDETVAQLADGLPAAASPRRPPIGARHAVDEMRLEVQRAGRGWRARAEDAEGRLAAAEAIIAAVPDPLILLDQRRRIVRANTAATALVGLLLPLCDLAAVLRNPAVLTAADAVLRGEAARIVEFALAAPVERQLRARFARVGRPAPDGAVAVLTLHDVTELKRAEQMRADFIANASHELRTPLATLTGFIETLRGPARHDVEARERFLAIMGGQATRMSRLVEDLLSLSRIELNEHVAPLGRVALPALLQHLAETLELRAGERAMRIALSLPSDLPDVQGDRDELAQLFQNLLDNAIKYGRAGTEIDVGAETSRRAAGSFVSVAVRDRGEGIAREHVPRLTERFYRVDTARSREMGGTGLGLAIVKHIVNRHRGFLEIDSKPGEGSVFTVLLRPRALAIEPPPRIEDRGAAANG
ncbi:MAG TPA: ATP-binding protein [Stellaceae bacterium]|jgi:two-component system phosphate regulon sensor histidine kinase PhoR|nr:ATP-binding protein [Stellaceae bacterium]